MNYNLVLGENKPLNSNIVTVKIKWKNNINKKALVVGITDENGQIKNENDCIFSGKLNQNRYTVLSGTEAEMNFNLNLNMFKDKERINIFLGLEIEKITKIGEVEIEVISGSDRFNILYANKNEIQAIKIFEIYSNKNIWKIKYTGMMNEKNIFEIFSSYGIDLKKIGFNKQPEVKISFDKSKKIVLEKGHKISLAKQTKDLGNININLNWNSN
ncbi:MAG: hypothetical protein ACRC5G_07730, partial [Cetobacterium sp.]